MKLTQIIGFSMLSLFALCACNTHSTDEQNSVSKKEVAIDIMAEGGTCTLISLDNTGHPRARVMDPFPAEDDFIIWFGTNPKSRKVAEIRNDSRVVVHFYDKPNGAYVSIYGQGEIITSENLLKKYWKPEWQTFYPEYPEGYVLIKVNPNRLELLSESQGVLGDSITWQPASIEFNN